MVTLGQYVKVLQAQEAFSEDLIRLDTEIIKIFGLDNLSKSDCDKRIYDIIEYISREVDFIKTFKIGEKEFGFIPNLNKITTGEWIDLENYQGKPEFFHKIMAILYRPITNKYKDIYEIEPYLGTEEFENLMLEVDVNIFKSVMVFFYHIEKELLIDSGIYIMKEKN
jgi:hypothetical protein